MTLKMRLLESALMKPEQKKKIIMKSNRYQHQVQGNLCALIKLVFMWKNGQVISLKRYELLVHFYATHALNPSRFVAIFNL